ncbi:Cytochrome P450 [Theobroma cacao]|uniref:Cytochrome P450 n=1 Tax=Theobroma cacao TaxID=3641 RepID=A0A061E9I4_THECC|nr:Cytochrome P450 [Theobroma cacao]
MTSMAANLSALLTGSLCLYLVIALIKILHKYWWTPLRIQYAMNLQGIKGPPYKFIHGNNKETVKMKHEALSKPMASLSHDIFPRVNPPVYSRINSYGKNYLSWGGTTAQLFITEPELVKEVLKSSERAFPKRTSRERKRNEDEFALMILGDGLVTSEGEKWARQRKLANYAFHGDSLKSMTPAVIASVETMLERWKQFEGKEIDVFEDFRLLTSEVISRTAFGSSYLDGKKIFDMLLKLSVLTNRNLFKAKFPVISNFCKTADEIESEKLVKGIHNSVMEIVKKREEKVLNGEANSFGTDFLGLLVSAYHDADKKNRLSGQDLVDECKTFYFTGQETTNSALAWAVLLLAINPDWQEKARREVIEVFGNQNPHSEGIGRLKTMTMIINETLRLYPPINSMVRKVENEVQLGKLILPADLHVVVPIVALHHDPQLWGDDANLFKPERFSEGISNATKHNAAAYIPFGLGPRSCVGMSFAMTEAKTALSMILQRYTISLSPTYSHSPCTLLLLQPQHGIQVILHSL